MLRFRLPRGTSVVSLQLPEILVVVVGFFGDDDGANPPSLVIFKIR